MSPISGVLGAYRACIQRIQLYGPTNFAPTVNHVANIARSFTDGSQYFILLIVTDGIITDMPQTKSVRQRIQIFRNRCYSCLVVHGSLFDEMLLGHY